LKRHVLGLPPLPEPPVTDAPSCEATPVPKPTIPEDVRRILEWNTAAEVARRNREATAVMFKQVGKPSPYV
jgi:hypothetical protein